MTKEKETNFFYNKENYDRGFDWYLSTYYKEAAGYFARGEASPGYFYRQDFVASRIKSEFPKEPPKFIVLLRDPVERAWSHYLHMVRNSEESESFETALLLEQKRLLEKPDLWVGYYQDGLYFKQLKRWLNYFPIESFHFILNSDLKNFHAETVRSCFKFLGVDEEFPIGEPIEINIAAQPRFALVNKLLINNRMLRIPFAQLSVETKKKLVRFVRKVNMQKSEKPSMSLEVENELRLKYQDDIAKLEQITKLDLTAWKSAEV